MEEFINELNKDMGEVLNLLKHCTSKSKQYKLMQDYYTLQEIYKRIGKNNIPKLEEYNHMKFKKEDLIKYLNKRFSPIFYKDLMKNRETYFELIILVCDILQKYNDEEVCELTSIIDINETINMSLDFLKNYDLRIYDTLKELINSNRVVYINNYISYYYGLSYNLMTNHNSYILMNFDFDINNSITLVHETGHIYDFDKNKNNSINKYMNSFLVNSCIEIFPNYLEQVYKEFLKTKKVYVKDLNIIDKKDIQTLFNTSKRLLKIITNENSDFEFDKFKNNLSEMLAKICSFYYCDIYLEDPEMAKYYTELLLENIGLYDDITILEKSGIDIDELPEKLEKKLQKIYKG